jgi:hypothetical protein
VVAPLAGRIKFTLPSLLEKLNPATSFAPLGELPKGNRIRNDFHVASAPCVEHSTDPSGKRSAIRLRSSCQLNQTCGLGGKTISFRRCEFHLGTACVVTNLRGWLSVTLLPPQSSWSFQHQLHWLVASGGRHIRIHLVFLGTQMHHLPLRGMRRQNEVTHFVRYGNIRVAGNRYPRSRY